MLMIPVGPSHVQFPALDGSEKLLCPTHGEYERWQVTAGYIQWYEIRYVLRFECGIPLDYKLTTSDMEEMGQGDLWLMQHRSLQDWALFILGKHSHDS